jgi:hypothetical protein
LYAQGDGFVRRENFSAEAARLGHGPARQIAAVYPRRKAQVVFDAGAETGLASAQNDQVVGCGAGAGVEADAASHFRVGRVGETAAILEEHHREAPLFGRQHVQGTAHLRIAVSLLRVEPLVVHLVARQKLAELVGAARPSRAEHLQSLERRPVGCLPIAEQIVQNRIEVLLGRVPGLEQVMMQL